MSLRALLGTAGIAILAGIGAPTAAPAQNAVAPPSPVCRPRTTPVSQAPATLIKQATERNVRTTLHYSRLHARALGREYVVVCEGANQGALL